MTTQTNNYDLIITIVNRGFSETVMDAAREKGATGGTILHGRGTGAKQAELFNLVIQEEKEAILIVVTKESRNDIMDAIMHAAGISTEAQGVTFTLPVEDFVVMSKSK